MCGAQPILERVTFAFDGITVLLGPSGSGKSTIAWAAVGLLPPELIRTRGALLLDGTNLFASAEHRRAVGIVPQEPDVALDPRISAASQMRAVLRACGRPARPDDVDAELSKHAFPLDRRDALPGRLSGGERRRVVLALAFARRPRLMLVDEPTVGLDGALAMDVTARLLAARSNRQLMVVATHDGALARRIANRIVVVSDGRVVEERAAANFWSSPQSAVGRGFVEALRVP